MTTHILIMLFTVFGAAGGPGMTSTTAEFNDQQSCMEAGKRIVADLDKTRNGTVRMWGCFPKGAVK